MATNANEYLVWGWSNQQLAGVGSAPVGYAQPATQAPTSPAVTTASQVSAGLPSPAGSENVQGENATSQSAQILTNPGYAGGNGTMLGVVTPPAMPLTTVAIQNPFGLAAQVTVSGGTVTVIAVAPNTPTGAGTFNTLETGDAVPNNQVLVPGGGWIKLTYSAPPTWTWTTTN